MVVEDGAIMKFSFTIHAGRVSLIVHQRVTVIGFSIEFLPVLHVLYFHLSGAQFSLQ